MLNDVYITKNELMKKLLKGDSLQLILPSSPGQGCDYFTTYEWPEKDDIICYIPSYQDNRIDPEKKRLTKAEIGNILSECYTKKDFLKEAFYNEACAKDLWSFCDWQHPCITDLQECTDDQEAKDAYGENWEEMEKRCKLIRPDIERYLAYFSGGEYGGETISMKQLLKLRWNGEATEDLSDVRRHGGFTRREELDKLPLINGYLSPMWEKMLPNGKIVVRYETQEMYDLLTS